MPTKTERIAVVTGGGSGAAVAQALAEDRWTVVLAGRRKEALEAVTKSTTLDGRAFDIACGQIDIGNRRPTSEAEQRPELPRLTAPCDPSR